MTFTAEQVAQLLRIVQTPTELTPIVSRQAASSFGSEWKIVVADRGFVLHGRVHRDGEYVVIEDCSTIRYWGTPSQNTDSGLGFLARQGPTKETKMDRQPTTRIHELQIVQLIDVEKAGPWRAA